MRYEPLKKYVTRAGGVRLSSHPRLRDQIIDWAVEDFPVDAEPERKAEVLAARLRIRAREKYGSIVATVLIWVLVQLIVKAVVAWWERAHAHRVLMVGWQEQARAQKDSDL